MSGGRRPPDDDVVYLDDDAGRDDVARALEEAERAVSAVQERHKRPEEPVAEGPNVEELERERAESRERAARAEEELRGAPAAERDFVRAARAELALARPVTSSQSCRRPCPASRHSDLLQGATPSAMITPSAR